LRTKNRCFQVLYFSPFFFIQPELSGLPSLSIKFPSRITAISSLIISFPAGSTTLTLIEVGASLPELNVDIEGLDFIDSTPGDRSEPLPAFGLKAPNSRVERFARSCREERVRGMGAFPSVSRRRAEGTLGGGLRLRPINPPPTLPRNVDPRSLLLDFILDPEGLGLEGTVVVLPTSLLEVLDLFIFGLDKREPLFETVPLADERGLLASVVSPPSPDSSMIGRVSLRSSS